MTDPRKMNTETPWHRASCDRLLHERLPQLLAERLPVLAYRVEAARERGHAVSVVDYLRCYMDITSAKQLDDLSTEAGRFGDARGLLLDAYRPGLPGGTGETFDWEGVTEDGFAVGDADGDGKAEVVLADGRLAAGEHAVRWTGETDRGRPAPAGDITFELVDSADIILRTTRPYTPPASGDTMTMSWSILSRM